MSKEIYYSSRMTSDSVLTSRDGRDVRANYMTRSTFAQKAPRDLMELKRALEHRSSMALTPYKPNAWEVLLFQAGLSSIHSGIINGL
jgi:hypothetical protein